MTAKYNFQTRIVLVSQEDQTGILIFSQIVLLAVGTLKTETFQIWIVLLVGVIKRGSPYLVRVKLLDNADIVLVMVAQVKVSGVELAIVEHHQNGVVALEFSQIFSPSIVVEAQDITVEPYLSPSEGGTAFLLQGNLMNRQTGEDHSLCLTSFDADFAEITFEDNASYAWVRL